MTVIGVFAVAMSVAAIGYLFYALVHPDRL
ncbi:MAG: potassium-transporting ATPase subunit F [Propionibacteriaceae bacterium]|nr:potassium-transporting ATPase subunit F [Propionibacteriaceae bacterium]